MANPTEFDAKAAESGANATRVFQSKEATARPEISKERVDEVATAAIKALHEVIRDKQVTYQEYDALKAWMIQVGLDGEWPLFLDVWIEHVVEEVANADREGSKGTIEGPYYVPDAPELPAECTLEMREDEAGTPLLFEGQVRAVDGTPLAGATVDIWHADDAGFYAQFAPGLPDWLPLMPESDAPITREAAYCTGVRAGLSTDAYAENAELGSDPTGVRVADRGGAHFGGRAGP